MIRSDADEAVPQSGQGREAKPAPIDLDVTWFAVKSLAAMDNSLAVDSGPIRIALGAAILAMWVSSGQESLDVVLAVLRKFRSSGPSKTTSTSRKVGRLLAKAILHL